MFVAFARLVRHGGVNIQLGTFAKPRYPLSDPYSYRSHSFMAHANVNFDR